MTSVEITLSAAVFIALIHQLGFQPRHTANMVKNLVAGLQEHAERCDKELARINAILMTYNPEPAE